MKNLIIKLHQKALSNPTIVKAIHSFWQAFTGTFLVGISGVLGTHSLSDGKTALIALTGAALASALSAAKSTVWPTVVSWASQTQPHITQ